MNRVDGGGDSSSQRNQKCETGEGRRLILATAKELSVNQWQTHQLVT